METRGNSPLSELNYARWPGIMPVVNDKARVYQIWANGNERLYYKGGTQELNVALAHLADARLRNRFVVLRAGPAVTRSFDGKPVQYSWELHVVGGLAGRHATDKTTDLEWYREPVLTVYVGGDIDLDKLKVPEGVTLRAAPGKREAATQDEAVRLRIEEFVKSRKTGRQPE
jgi:hypothetical protein